MADPDYRPDPPSLNPRVASSWAKFLRAKAHADQLIAEMRDASDGNAPGVYETSRKYDPDTEQVIFIAERMTEISDNWSLIVGDCIHNLRCALDHLWWQFAIDFLGREPTDDEARDIQFPILTDRPEAWEGHRFLKHVDPEIAAKAKPIQAYDRGEGEEPVIAILASLSNADKHREVKPTFYRSTEWGVEVGDLPCRDCHIPRDAEDPEIWESTITWPFSETKVGDAVLGIKVVPTGPNPDIDINPHITGYIGFGPKRDVLTTLNKLGALVATVIREFTPLLKHDSATSS
jgi:hypothetical protein